MTQAQDDAGILAVLGPTGLQLKQSKGAAVRAWPDASALTLTALADQASSRRIRLAIGCPPNARHLPLLIAATSVLGDTVRSAAESNFADSGVLFISPDLDARSKYPFLCVGHDDLDTAHPGSRVARDGSLKLLRPHMAEPHYKGVCYFYPGLELPDALEFNPRCILVDARWARWVRRIEVLDDWLVSRFPKHGISVLYTDGDDDTRSILIRRGYADFPMDALCTSMCADQMLKSTFTSPGNGTIVDWSIGNISKLLERRFKLVPSGESTELARKFADLESLLVQQAKLDTPDLRRARWLFSVLTQMCVPIKCYEQAAVALGRHTLRRLVSQIGNLARGDLHLGPYLQTLRMMLDAVYNALQQDNPRALTFRKMIEDELLSSEDAHILVLVRDNVVERAVRNWLELEVVRDSDFLNKLDVYSFSKYLEYYPKTYTAALLGAPLTRRYKWVLGGHLAADIKIASIRADVGLIQRQVAAVYDETLARHKEDLRYSSVGKLAPPPAARYGGLPAMPAYSLVLPTSELEAETPKETPGSRKLRNIGKGLEPLGTLIESMTKERVESEPSSLAEDEGADAEDVFATSAKDSDRDIDVEALGISVNSRNIGEGRIWLAVDNITECVRESEPDKILRLLPRELEVGDVLVLMNEGERAGVFDKMIDIAEDRPELRSLTAYRLSWQGALRRLASDCTVDGKVDYARALELIRAAGSPIATEQSVRAWITDQVIAPLDPESIIAVGRVTRSETMVRAYKEFDSAFRRIRAIHSALGRRVNQAIRQSFFSKRSKATGDVLEEQLELPLEELLEAIDLAEVLSIDKEPTVVQQQQTARVTPVRG